MSKAGMLRTLIVLGVLLFETANGFKTPVPSFITFPCCCKQPPWFVYVSRHRGHGRHSLALRAQVASEVSNVLLRYGVPASDHEGLMKELMPLIGGSSKTANTKVQKLDIKVVRSNEGGLGIDVDKSNVIFGNRGQRDLQLGDRVLAIDGVPLGKNFVAQGLAAGKLEYTFTVERGGGVAAGLEDALISLAAGEEVVLGKYGLSAQNPREGTAATKFVEAAQSLEALGLSIDAEKLKGFWRLVFTNDAKFVATGGASGFAGMPFCYLVAHLQCYQDKVPTGQTVEIVANTNLGTHSIAALKGSWDIAPESAASVSRLVTEKYDRAEYAGALQTTKMTIRENEVTFVADKVRISRRGDGALYVYVRVAQDKVAGLIQGLIETTPPGVAPMKPKWQQDGPPSSGPGASTLGN